jgi:uncharacterized protein (DUF302 family)
VTYSRCPDNHASVAPGIDLINELGYLASVRNISLIKVFFRGATPLIVSLIVGSLVSLSTIAQTSSRQQPTKTGVAWVYSTQGEYGNVRQDLVDAIESYGMVVSYTAHAASMFQRTASAVGAIKQVYDFADILLFCKANASYELTLANPHAIILCPYSIAVYSLRKDKSTVYISFREPDLDIPEYAAIHQLLENIVSEVVD